MAIYHCSKEVVLAEYGGEWMPEVWEKAKNLLRGGVTYYDSYLRGECYGFELYKAGEISEAVGALSGTCPACARI